MPLSAGHKLGPYEILAPLGAGGMGQVWKARDTRLDRIVAIKSAHEKFSERFEREARAVAALNHPNICQLYDVGPDYLVMEYVEGAPVAPPDSPRKLLDMAVQMSDGLSAAHAAGIVHRDLKPDNILIAKDGRIKILDFGLAKAAHEDLTPSDATQTVALGVMNASLTNPGTTLGTIAYMSPEQARGQANLTAQSDQFSLGLVLYELAAGKPTFPRSSAAEIMTAIIREDPEPLPASVPVAFRWIVERLLAKEPADRYDSTRDLYRELRQLRDRPTESVSAIAIPAVEAASPRAPSTSKRPVMAVFGLAGLLLGAGLAALAIHPAATDLSAYRFTPISRDEASEMYPVWSPDGKSIAYLADIHGIYHVFVKAVGSADTTQLTHGKDNCESLFWSPDGGTIYYASHGNLWAVGASGGTPEVVMEKAGSMALHPDGKTLVFNRQGKMWAGEVKGGTPRELPTPQVPGAVPIAFSPDGSRLLVRNPRSDYWILPWPSGTPRILGGNFLGQPNTQPWLPDSRHLVENVSANGGSALALLDVTDGSSRVIYRSPDASFFPSVSPDGRKIAYSAGAPEWNVLEISLPEGRVHTVVGGGGVSYQPGWAPSGTHFLFSTTRSGQSVIEDWSAAEGFSRRVADAPEGSTGVGVSLPEWAPDGKRFLYRLGSGQQFRLMIADAAGTRRSALADIRGIVSYTWSPDGEWIAFVRAEGGKAQLAKMKPVSGAAAVPLTGAAMAGSTIQWTPAGDWIAYPSPEGMSMISADGNTVRKLTDRRLSFFAFSHDGAQLYGVVRNTTGEGAQWQLYSVDVKTGADKMLAAIDLPASANGITGFSLHPDGKRFLTSVGKMPYDIWMLEGWDQQQKSWLDRLLRR
jgi:serine/threonine protein kinase/Tol biopolymer transport system component